MRRKSRRTPSAAESLCVVLVRHAEAVEAADFSGSDLDRPLTSKGWKTARKIFQRLENVVPSPRLVLHSAARRARETAEALQESHPRARLVEEPALNPGAAPGVFRRLTAPAKGTIVLVGHEPDLSAALLELTGARCRLRKASMAVIEKVPEGFELVALLAASHLRAMRRP